MTEQEWLASDDPQAMLRHLAAAAPPSDRKLRLFACACCRHPAVWGLLADPRSRRAVEVAERFADGEATEEERRVAYYDAGQVFKQDNQFEKELAWKCAGPVEVLTANAGLPRWFSVSTKYAAVQAALIREIFGNPWRPVSAREPLTCSHGHAAFAPVKKNSYPVPLSACLVCHEDGPPWPDVERGKSAAWLTPDIARMARAAYDARDWQALPVLADVLEEAGCQDEWLANHLHGLSPHFRGCFAVDCLLGLS